MCGRGAPCRYSGVDDPQHRQGAPRQGDPVPNPREHGPRRRARLHRGPGAGARPDGRTRPRRPRAQHEHLARDDHGASRRGPRSPAPPGELPCRPPPPRRPDAGALRGAHQRAGPRPLRLSVLRDHGRARSRPRERLGPRRSPLPAGAPDARGIPQPRRGLREVPCHRGQTPRACRELARARRGALARGVREAREEARRQPRAHLGRGPRHRHRGRDLPPRGLPRGPLPRVEAPRGPRERQRRDGGPRGRDDRPREGQRLARRPRDGRPERPPDGPLPHGEGRGEPRGTGPPPPAAPLRPDRRRPRGEREETRHARPPDRRGARAAGRAAGRDAAGRGVQIRRRLPERCRGVARPARAAPQLAREVRGLREARVEGEARGAAAAGDPRERLRVGVGRSTSSAARRRS